MARDKANLDIFWLRDESLDDAASLKAPEVIAAEIIEDLQTALDEMSLIYTDLAVWECFAQGRVRLAPHWSRLRYAPLEMTE
jgi:hypothetical protein